MKELMPCFSFRDNFLPPSNGAGNEDQEMEVRGEKEQLTRSYQAQSPFCGLFPLQISPNGKSTHIQA